MTRIAISIHHPAHVHFFKNAIKSIEDSEEHETFVFVRDKEIITKLLEEYEIDYEKLSENFGSKRDLFINTVKYEYFLFKKLRRLKPDVVLSVGSGALTAYIAKLVGATCIAFNDSESAQFQNKIGHAMVDELYTPTQFEHDLGEKHVRYDGYHELAYLQPDRFSPDPARLREHGVDPKEEFYVLRFIAWGAHHDVGEAGLSPEAQRELVSTLEETGTVYITTEDELPAEFEEYRLPVPPHLIHDLLYYADLYVGDSQTMATEAAVLGTPSIRSNSFAGDDDMSNFVELEEEYGLLYSTPDEDEAIRKVRELLSDPDLAETWRQRQERLLEDKTDVTRVLVDAIAEGETA